jgi:hypothetical protein
MVRIEYTLIYDDFAAAMKVARQRNLDADRKHVRGSKAMWVMSGMFSALFLGGALLWNVLIPDRAPGAPPRTWQEVYLPHVFWVIVLLCTLASLLVLSLRLVKSQVPRMWERMYHLHQPRTAEFDDAGVREMTALFTMNARWTLFRDFAETPDVFILFTSVYTFEIFPKRAFGEGQMSDFRALVAAHVTSRTTAFPVIPVAGIAAPPVR